MIIDHTLKLVLLHVPKCAGTSLRQAFLEDGQERDVVSFFDFEYNTVLHRQVDKAHLPLMDLRHYPEWRLLKRYQVIACIQHPYQRLASACREFLRQNSRETEVQMRTQLPSQEQRLAYLRRLPAAMDAHDLRWVHGFPIHWFTHYGSKAKVQHLIRCSHLAEDLADLGSRLQWPNGLRKRLAAVGAGAGRRPTADLNDLSQDPNLRAMANLMHSNDFAASASSAARPALRIQIWPTMCISVCGWVHLTSSPSPTSRPKCAGITAAAATAMNRCCSRSIAGDSSDDLDAHPALPG